MKINKTKLVTPLAALALMLSAAGGFVAEAHADTTTAAATTSTTAVPSSSTDQGPGGNGTHTKPAAVGTVTAVSGDTITLTDKQSGTTYTVDATTATIMKQLSSSGTDQTDAKPTAPTTATISDIAVGDTLMVQGTVSGTSITATRIDDGVMRGGMGGGRGGFGGGNGGSGVSGTVTAVNGTTLTITGKNGTTYTVDGSSATASKIETITVPSIAVGDTVGINGTVSGTTVTAKNIMDGMPQMQSHSGTTALTDTTSTATS
jgi:hypothetical protein